MPQRIALLGRYVGAVTRPADRGEQPDTAWFSLTDAEWPDLRTRNQRWLDPANFDENGEQRRPLGEV